MKRISDLWGIDGNSGAEIPIGPHDDILLQRFEAIRSDPWEFLPSVRTLDQVDKINPVKQFPVYLDYIRLYVRVWQKYPLIAIPKSRRMKMSWTNIALYTWDTMFFIGRFNAFVSKKEEDSDELVRRVKFILENLDNSGLPRELVPTWEYTYNKIRFPELNSMIQGFPSGADQLRQYTFSGMLWDELAFWDNAKKAYAASFPTLEGGGRATFISSPGPGFFKDLVFDALDEGAE